MIEQFLFVGLPYLALAALVVGMVWRFRSARFGISALSSQFLEHRSLRWGSTAWHTGIIVILLVHILVFLAPGLWASLVTNEVFLIAVETLGIALAVLATIGMAILVVRRLVSAKVQAVTTPMDLVVQWLLLVQIALGLMIAVNYRWGSAWAPGTVVPYLWSVLAFAPDASFVIEMPALVKAHVVGAFVLIGLIPYSRLIHIVTVPLHYVLRAPQVVIWSNLGRVGRAATARVQQSRRLFVTGSVATAGAGVLLGVGVMDKLVRYFQGPKLSTEEEARLLEERLVRINATAEQRQLELERLRRDFIEIGRLGELESKKGRYFIDYEMRPALAFRDDDGMPLLISAKCTHLGCTVASEVNDQGQILCPCHISYFDIRTGQPNPGAPAKLPLPHLEWVLMDPAGAVLASRSQGQVAALPADAAQLAACTVFIAKRGQPVEV